MKLTSKGLSVVFGALGMGLLILDAKTALSGARDGIDLCIRTVVPSLFPFFVLSIFLTGAMTGQRVPLLRPVGKLCGIPEGTESLLLTGFLGGYPVGAQCVTQAYRAGKVCRQDAQRMLGFCNNAGPAFLFGMAGVLFSNRAVPWVLWGIQILSALMVAVILPGKSQRSGILTSQTSLSPSQVLNRAVKVMAGVCGWVVIFRVVIAIIQRWFLWLLPEAVQVAVMGALELSNGCCELAAIGNDGVRFILCGCMLSFGGLCVGMQTVSVTEGLGTGAYFPGKILQCAISFLLSVFFQSFLFPPMQRWQVRPWFCAAALVLTIMIAAVLRKKKISSGNLVVSGV